MYVKASSNSTKQQTYFSVGLRGDEEANIPYITRVFEKLRQMYSKYSISMHFKFGNTHGQRLVQPKDKTLKHKLSGVINAVQCSKECSDLCIGGNKRKQQLHERMAKHRRANLSGQDSAVHLHLKDKQHFYGDTNVHILDREERWFER